MNHPLKSRCNSQICCLPSVQFSYAGCPEITANGEYFNLLIFLYKKYITSVSFTVTSNDIRGGDLPPCLHPAGPARCLPACIPEVDPLIISTMRSICFSLHRWLGFQVIGLDVCRTGVILHIEALAPVWARALGRRAGRWKVAPAPCRRGEQLKFRGRCLNRLRNLTQIVRKPLQVSVVLSLSRLLWASAGWKLLDLLMFVLRRGCASDLGPVDCQL